MLLIWLHGVLLAHQNPVKHIYEDLVEAGFQPLAGKLFYGAQCTLQCPLQERCAVLRALLVQGRCDPGQAGGHCSFPGHWPCWEVRLLEEEHLNET